MSAVNFSKKYSRRKVSEADKRLFDMAKPERYGMPAREYIPTDSSGSDTETPIARYKRKMEKARRSARKRKGPPDLPNRGGGRCGMGRKCNRCGKNKW